VIVETPSEGAAGHVRDILALRDLVPAPARRRLPQRRKAALASPAR
jgi:hypothetical protein